MLAEGHKLAVAAAVGHAEPFVGDRRPIDQGLAGYVARTREPLLIEGTPDAEQMSGLDLMVRHHLIAEPRIASSMCVPLVFRSELLGVLNLSVTHGPRRYNEYDLRALGLFAEHAAMAIRHAKVLSREQEMRSHIAELDRLRAELVASMAHDLKTPLTTILGVAKVLRRRAHELSPEQQHEFIVSVESQAERLLALIGRLLDAARSQAGQVPLSPGLLELGRIVRSIVASFSSAHGRTIGVDIAQTPVHAFADPEAFEHVLANLLENAMKHTPSDASVDVHVRTKDDVVEITVHDEGPGMPPDVQRDLFQPFQRGRAGGTGTGLGLFIASNLIRATGGTLTVRSAEGVGSSFVFTVPRRPAENVAAQIGLRAPAARGG